MSLRDRAVEIFRRSVERMDPAALCAAAARDVAGDRVRVLAVGKAAAAMARGAAEGLGSRLVDGVVVAPDDASVPAAMNLLRSSHPTPDERSEVAGRRLLAEVRRSDADRILFLISGGASALAAVPAQGVRLAQKSEALAALYGAGAPIDELNCARKHLSAIKGGRLAVAAAVPVTTFVVSDVAGDDVSVVGSGPTVGDPTTFADAVSIFERYVGLDGAVAAHLRRGAAGQIEDTPSVTPEGHEVRLLAGMRSMVAAAADEARAATYDVRVIEDDVVGDVEAVAERLVSLATASDADWLRIHVAVGEATIALPPSPGSGGRAHHVAMLVARGIAGRSGVAVLVGGTDGIDGNTRAAGAVVDGATWAGVLAAGIDGDRALAEADTGAALSAVGATLACGPTGVNHADLMLVLCDSE